MNKQPTLGSSAVALLTTGNAASTDAYTRSVRTTHSVRTSSRTRLRVNRVKAALTNAQVRWALEKYFTENVDERMTQRAIAQQPEVSRQTIARLMRSETWSRSSVQSLALIGHGIWD